MNFVIWTSMIIIAVESAQSVILPATTQTPLGDTCNTSDDCLGGCCRLEDTGKGFRYTCGSYSLPGAQCDPVSRFSCGCVHGYQCGIFVAGLQGQPLCVEDTAGTRPTIALG